jgi:hypothetical protein
MNKKLLVLPLLLGINSVASDYIYISENYINHYCKNIDKISVTSASGTKEELFELLKEKARKLSANSIIQAEYGGGFYGTQSIASGIAADCDVSKSPSFYLKRPESEIKKNLFGFVSVSNENVEMEAGKIKETQSSIGINAKLGVLKNNYRYYGNVNAGVGLSLLASADYIFFLNNNISLFAGGSLGTAQYELSSSGKSINTMVTGFQFGVRYLNFEFALQKLSASNSTKVDGKEYKPSNISMFTLGYYF